MLRLGGEAMDGRVSSLEFCKSAFEFGIASRRFLEGGARFFVANDLGQGERSKKPRVVRGSGDDDLLACFLAD